jgi:hypothetical protein
MCSWAARYAGCATPAAARSKAFAPTSSGQLYAFGENHPTTTPIPDSAEPDGLNRPQQAKTTAHRKVRPGNSGENGGEEVVCIPARPYGVLCSFEHRSNRDGPVRPSLCIGAPAGPSVLLLAGYRSSAHRARAAPAKLLANCPNFPRAARDARTSRARSILRQWGSAALGSADLLVAGPHCQCFGFDHGHSAPPQLERALTPRSSCFASPLPQWFRMIGQ